MQESIQTWAGESAWRFENLIYNELNSQFKAIGMRRLSEKQNRKKFIKLFMSVCLHDCDIFSSLLRTIRGRFVQEKVLQDN